LGGVHSPATQGVLQQGAGQAGLCHEQDPQLCERALLHGDGGGDPAADGRHPHAFAHRHASDLFQGAFRSNSLHPARCGKGAAGDSGSGVLCLCALGEDLFGRAHRANLGAGCGGGGGAAYPWTPRLRAGDPVQGNADHGPSFAPPAGDACRVWRERSPADVPEGARELHALAERHGAYRSLRQRR
ncbi:unnamed protein product, partial [Effrenium voratum]